MSAQPDDMSLEALQAWAVPDAPWLTYGNRTDPTNAILSVPVTLSDFYRMVEEHRRDENAGGAS